jgi:hypothetical protein
MIMHHGGGQTTGLHGVSGVAVHVRVIFKCGPAAPGIATISAFPGA